MDTFNHQDRIFTHLQFLTFIDTFTRTEIKSRHFYFFPRQQILHLAVIIRQIEGIKRLEIIIARLVFRRIFPIEEIIIERNSHRMDQIRYQLDFQTLAESCLSGRRRSRDQNNTDTFFISLRNLFRNLSNLFFLHCFRNHYNFGSMPLLDSPVQIAHIIQIQCALQSQMLFISLEHLILRDSRLQFQRITSLRYLEQHPVEIRNDIEQLDITGGRRQAAIKEIDIAIQLIIRSARHPGSLDQTRLVIHSPFTEKDSRIHRPDCFMQERHIGIDNFTHTLLDLVDCFKIDLFAIMDYTVVSFRYRMFQI